MIKEIYTLYVERWRFFLSLTGEHLQISLVSIAVAAIIGLGLGILISLYRKSSSTVLGLTNFIYTIPSIALFGFLIPFSGIGNTTAIIALSIYALLPGYRPGDHRGGTGHGKYHVPDTLQDTGTVGIPRDFVGDTQHGRHDDCPHGYCRFYRGGRIGRCHLPGYHDE